MGDNPRPCGQCNRGDEDPLDRRHNLHFNNGSVLDVVATSVSVFEAKQGFEQLLLEELRILVRLSRQEVGCLVFDVYRIAGRSFTFALHEVWETREAMEAHARNFHTTHFRIGAERYLARPIETLELEELI